ncbi:MAG TPA: hypothetical protein VKM94_07080 [Blastocatellia bacterium]|nr:hypothetical protein [Blastocatellia bacterium]
MVGASRIPESRSFEHRGKYDRENDSDDQKIYPSVDDRLMSFEHVNDHLPLAYRAGATVMILRVKRPKGRINVVKLVIKL